MNFAIDYIDDPMDLVFNIIKKNKGISKGSLGIMCSIWNFNTFCRIDRLLESGDIIEVKPNRYEVMK